MPAPSPSTYTATRAWDAKTLFATHYHELTQLAEHLPRVRNYNVAVSEDGGSIVFLRRIAPGGADRSYGIHVAQLAGMPASVVNRAWDVLTDLESSDATPPARNGRRRGTPRPSQPAQLPLMPMTSPALEALREIDVSSITPIEAINKLYELQERDRNAG